MASPETQRLNNRQRKGSFHRSENDFSPNTKPKNATRQLDFCQAMADFKHMFPTMDEEIIEAVLRSNNGAVDATIDQLLTMSIDNDDDTIPAAVLEQSLLNQAPSTSKEKPTATKDSPPSYTEAVQSAHHHHRKSRSSRHRHDNGCLPVANLLDLETDAVTAGNTTPKTIQNSVQHKSSHRSHTKKKTHKRWNPPLVGELPDDFLRLTPPPSYIKRTSPQSYSIRDSPISGNKHEKSRHPVTRTMSVSTHEFTTDMLKRKMKENERRRRTISHDFDPETSQFLEDERLAIMLQNSEFLQELRGNEDFMKTLERDRLNAVAFEPIMPFTEPVSTHSDRATSHSDATRASVADNSHDKKTKLKPTPAIEEESKIKIEPPPIVMEDPKEESEGYGNDRQNSLGAFPFTQPAPPLVKEKDEDAELRRQLAHMGRASRKQFAALARRFFSRRKKKSLRHILKETATPSMTNLLDAGAEVNSDDDVVTNNGYSERPQFERLPDTLQTVPNHRTVQRPPYHPDTIVTYPDRHRSNIV